MLEKALLTALRIFCTEYNKQLYYLDLNKTYCFLEGMRRLVFEVTGSVLSKEYQILSKVIAIVLDKKGIFKEGQF